MKGNIKIIGNLSLSYKTFITEYKQGDYNFPEIRPFEIGKEELQAINQKCRELGWIGGEDE